MGKDDRVEFVLHPPFDSRHRPRTGAWTAARMIVGEGIDPHIGIDPLLFRWEGIGEGMIQAQANPPPRQ